MIGCFSDEETQLPRGRSSSTDQVSRCLSESLSEETTDPYALSPIYRVPADVLHSIFELYCQVEFPEYFPLVFKPHQVIASQVCSAWRQIMLGNPVSWNKIKIEFWHQNRYDQYQMVEVPRIWLSRANDISCVIDLIDFHFIPCLTLSNHQPLWQLDINKNIVRDLIAPHNCKDLSVRFADHHLRDLLQLSDEKLSYIEVLRLLYVDELGDGETVSLLDFHRLTNLTSFSLEQVPVLRPGPPPVLRTPDQGFQILSRIPWHQLRHIHLDVFVPVLRCLTILETSSSLETCSLVVCVDRSTATSQKMPTRCQQLREFEVYIASTFTDVGDCDCDSFLLLLQLPKLKSLTLKYPDRIPKGVSVNLQRLLRMWSVGTMRPEKMVISGLMCKVDAGALLASIPSLRCLELPKGSRFTVDAIRELGAGSIGPFLEELTVNSDEIGELIEMVKIQSSTAKENGAERTRFKSVRLYCDDPDGSLQQKYAAVIDEINELHLIFVVQFLTPS